MKRLFLLLMAVASLISCDKGSEQPQALELTGGTSTSQTIYADETSKADGIKFIAKEPWTATVAAVKASDVDWLTLSRYSGSAGEFTLSLTLKENTSGSNRKAEIRINCGTSTITITVEQKTTNKPDEPENPEEPGRPNPERYVKSIIQRGFSSMSSNINYENILTFSYDESMRLVSMTFKGFDITGNGSETVEITGAMYFSYEDSKVFVLSEDKSEGLEIILDGKSRAVQYSMLTQANIATNSTTASGKKTIESAKMLFAPLHGHQSAKTKAQNIVKHKKTYELSYDTNGYVTEMILREQRDGVPGETRKYSTIWNTGNVVKVGLVDENMKFSHYDVLSYSTIKNMPCNLDLSAMISNTEWHSAFFGAMGLLDYMGKRSKFHPSSGMSYNDGKLSYGYNYDYTLDELGYVIECHATGATGSPNQMTYAIEYTK